MKHLTIVGGGFAGLWAAMSAAAERHRLGISPKALEIELINKDGNLVVRPRLYEGAHDDMKVPLQPLLDVIDVRLTQGLVVDIDPAKKLISLVKSGGLQDHLYGSLILASGSQIRALPIPGASQFAFDNDTFEGAAKLDEHLVRQSNLYENAESDFTVAVVGAGFTGIETAMELRKNFGEKIRIILLDQETEVGKELGSELKSEISNAMSKYNIETRLSSTITEIDEKGLTLDTGENLITETVIFATGLEASPLTKLFDAPKDQTGRLIVDSNLSLPGKSSVYIAGDTAYAMADAKHSTLMSCQHAMQLGRYAGYNAIRAIAGEPLHPYTQEVYRTCLDLGPAGAVFTEGWERKVQKTGDQGKAIKREINQHWIYPPNPDVGASAIFEAVGLSQELNAA